MKSPAPKKAPPKKSPEPQPLDLSALPQESVSSYEKSICLACVLDVFTRHLKLALRTAWLEIRRYEPPVAELQLGALDFADLMYLSSEEFVNDTRRSTGNSEFQPPHAILFGAKEGRIAKANRGKEPLYMFAALQRQLGYPAVPRVRPLHGAERELPALHAKLAQLEKRLHLVESELKGNLDLSQFYVKPNDVGGESETNDT